MADSVYENIDPRVGVQLTTRQEKLALDPKSSESLVVFNNNTAFIRLASSTNISTERAQNLNVTGFEGDKLAKACVLYNGTVGLTGEGTATNPFNYNPKGGVGGTPDIINDFAYGFGGRDFGYVPMPGIESVTINHAEASGALRKAKIKIRCWNTQQLNIIDALFFRLGSSCLLEFGHTVYFDNEGNYQTRRVFSTDPFNLLFQSGKNLSKKIEQALFNEKVKSSFNYDGLFGYIINYSWQYANNGFTVELEIASKGAIINYADAISKGTGNNVTPSTDRLPNLTIPLANATGSIADNTLPNTIVTNRDQSVLHYKIYSDLVELNKQQTNSISLIEGVKVSCFKTTINNNTEYYISLGRLLKLIETSILDPETNLPAVNFDTNVTSNFCLTFPQHLSLDPKVCVIPFKITNPEDQSVFEFSPELQTPEGDGFRVPGFSFMGYSMNILINTSYIFDLLNNKNIKTKEQIIFSKFILELLKGVSNALGNLNSLKYLYDSDLDLIKIYDDAAIPGSSRKRLNIPFTFNIYGLRDQSSSIVKDLQLQTGFTPAFQNSLLSVVTTSGVPIAVSRLNRGYSDRILKGTATESPSNTPATPFIDIASPTNVKNVKTNIWKGAKNVYSENADIKVLRDSQKDYKAYWGAYFKFLSDNYNATTAVLPLDLRITINGVSGLKIFNLFRVTTALIPIDFSRSIDFSISGLTDTIDSNGWITTIDTITRFRDPSDLDASIEIDSTEKSS
jgi:hypothetical protein